MKLRVSPWSEARTMSTVPPPAKSGGCGMEQNQMTAKENGGEQGTVENDGLGNRSQGTESPSQCGDHFEGD